jgi:hypothetical protein
MPALKALFSGPFLMVVLMILWKNDRKLTSEKVDRYGQSCQEIRQEAR